MTPLPPRPSAKLRIIATALPSDGSRQKIHPAETHGRFTRFQRYFFPLLIAVYAALPWVRINGAPAVMIDIPRRQFFLFGLTFNSSDFYLSFFVLSGIAFALVVTSALVGRVWCGFACPQTVFLEGIYRKVEALVEGPAHERAARQKGPWTAERVGRLGVKQVLFLGVSLLISHLFLAYFASTEGVLYLVRHAPSENWVAFSWTMAMTAVLHFNFGWFREQFCVVLCPYGRLQSVLADTDTVLVGYDAARGEPRGKKGTAGAGDCVDCMRCVQVCPTGIDIRKGLQLECVGCAHCIDACDEVMCKLERPIGLIRYDSQRGLEQQPRRFWRGRVYGYMAACLAGVIAMTLAVTTRKPFELSLMRAQNIPYQRVGATIVNRYTLHVGNKGGQKMTLTFTSKGPAASKVIVSSQSVELEPFEVREVPVNVESTPPVAPEERFLEITAVDDRGRQMGSKLPLLGL